MKKTADSNQQSFQFDSPELSKLVVKVDDNRQEHSAPIVKLSMVVEEKERESRQKIYGEILKNVAHLI